MNFRHFWTNKDDRIVIWQAPNALLILWAVLFILGKIFTNGLIGTAFHLLAAITLAAWAILEIISGASPFRRLLGGVFLAYLVYGLLN
jgi:hypothetical protein